MTDLSALKKKLSSDPKASQKFHADLMNLLKNNGVDVSDPNVQKHLGLDKLNVNALEVDRAASSIVITITA